jgi:hypothetical protein
MQSIPCPQGDGTCTIPDPAVVASDGQIKLLRLEEVERLLPGAEIDVGRLRPLRIGQSAAELTALADRDDDEALGAAREILDAAAGKSVVIVHCTCSHVYVLDT